MPPKKKNAIMFFIETTLVPELQREGYQFRNGIAALIPEGSRRYKVSMLVFYRCINFSACLSLSFFVSFAFLQYDEAVFTAEHTIEARAERKMEWSELKSQMSGADSESWKT